MAGDSIIVVTTNYVPESRMAKTIGPVFGIVVCIRSVGGNIVARLRGLIGGEINEYTKMLLDAREHAVKRLMKNAATTGANAVVDMRFDSSKIGQIRTEVVAYGAVIGVEKEDSKAEAVSLR